MPHFPRDSILPLDAPARCATLCHDEWSTSRVAGVPPPGEVWLWRADLRPHEGREQVCREWLSADERQRAASARLPEVARRRVLSRGLLRGVLGACLNVAPAAVELRYGPHGKPYLNGHDAPRFNLSHSGDAAVLAVTTGSDLGVDIERLRPGVDMRRIADRYLSLRDADSLRRMDPDQRQREFFRRWTLHEARLKAHGHGWAGNAGANDFCPGESVYEFEPETVYLGALVVLGAFRAVRKLGWDAAAGILV